MVRPTVVARLTTLIALTSVTSVFGVSGCSSSHDEDARSSALTETECVGTRSDALRTCSTGATVKGIDVSSYQGNVNWGQVKASLQAFAFVRISDGLTYPDAKFAQNWQALRSVQILRGAYQYFRPSQDPTLQAQMVLDKFAAAGGLRPGDFPPVLDLETTDGLAASVVVARAKTWIAKIESATGVKPIVYTAAFMSGTIGTHFGAYTLWVANYDQVCPLMPSGWTTWRFWQTSDSGSVQGIVGDVDTNLFNGDRAALEMETFRIQPPDGPDKGVAARSDKDLTDDSVEVWYGGSKPKDGSDGATLGDGSPDGSPSETQGAPHTPCP